MPRPHLLAIPALFVLLTLLTSPQAIPLEDLTLEQVLERANQAESAFHDRLKDYICRVTTTVNEPKKNGPPKILRVEEKTIYRKLPDKRLEKLHAVQKKEKALSPEELAEYAKKPRRSISSFGRSFFSSQRQTHYSYRLLAPDTVRGIPAHVLQLSPAEKHRSLIDGQIWLHGESFDPLKLDCRPAKNPKYIKELHIVMEFAEAAPAIWLPAEVNGEGRAGFLFINKDFIIHERWSDYQINVGLDDSLFSQDD